MKRKDLLPGTIFRYHIEGQDGGHLFYVDDPSIKTWPPKTVKSYPGVYDMNRVVIVLGKDGKLFSEVNDLGEVAL